MHLIPDNYLNEFVGKTKSINYNDRFPSEGEIEFEIDLINKETIYNVIKDYNDEFDMDFKVNNLYQDDQLYFATICSSKAKNEDIFYLGYLVELKSAL
ncbi:MAG: hypothetical protein WCK82_08120 [Bacteroidota bacterium]